MLETFNNFFMLLCILILVGLGLGIGVVFLMARMLLRPRRMTDGWAVYLLKRLSPLDLGLEYEETGLEGEGGIRIVGWWIPCGGSKNCAVLIHGYADAKVGAIAWG